ncbi:protein PMR5-like [Dioscorea cayenensis subsp. rotundata]|uniref:Protein PMR5-like n=1 Tax=Dioscorea cayennensis subsp. rotundata TaxID=55577 RepID=A0AB40D423_DIOCR|nr:protein PMR5-like [Dioscorea cayenensis subsp. rotundata]
MNSLLPLSILLLCFFFFFFIQAQFCFSAVVFAVQKHRRQSLLTAETSCDIFTGSWVQDESYPLYYFSSCPVIDPQFNCQLFGRPDSNYLHYRWKPATCELPRFDGIDFLTRMRGKTVMFVGDSLGRNQWESLICMLHAQAEASPTQFIKGDPLSIFNFVEYEVSISFYRAPYLVDIVMFQGRRILQLDEISVNGEAWKDADVLLFNSGHWWTHKGSLQGWDYMGDDGVYYLDMDRLVAFQRGMSTWANWVDLNIDRTRTRVFFQSISPTHYNPTEWNDPVSKNCYGETAPVNGFNYSGVYPVQTRVLEGVVKAMRYPAHILDITSLSELRKDGHPSIYNGDLSPDQRANPDQSADCSHWCLPGLPDTWNQLFYTTLLF